MAEILLEDESLRDGFQFEDVIIRFEEKLLLFGLLREAGVRTIQVGSLVKSTMVPQLADTAAFASWMIYTTTLQAIGLVLDNRGLDRAISYGLQQISASASACDSHCMKKVCALTQDAFDAGVKLIRLARQSGIAVGAGAQCAFGYA